MQHLFNRQFAASHLILHKEFVHFSMKFWREESWSDQPVLGPPLLFWLERRMDQPSSALTIEESVKSSERMHIHCHASIPGFHTKGGRPGISPPRKKSCKKAWIPPLTHWPKPTGLQLLTSSVDIARWRSRRQTEKGGFLHN